MNIDDELDTTLSKALVKLEPDSTYLLNVRNMPVSRIKILHERLNGHLKALNTRIIITNVELAHFSISRDDPKPVPHNPVEPTPMESEG